MNTRTGKVTESGIALAFILGGLFIILASPWLVKVYIMYISWVIG